MAYFVTGATGFIGRHLVEQLLKRDGDIYVLVREGSMDKLRDLIDRWGAEAKERVKPVTGDLSEAQLGVSDEQGSRTRAMASPGREFELDLRDLVKRFRKVTTA